MTYGIIGLMFNNQGFSPIYTLLILAALSLVVGGIYYISSKQNSYNSHANISAEINKEYSLDKITLNNPIDPKEHTTRIERNKYSIQLIAEYRPKGQVYDFALLTIKNWDPKTRPLPNTVEPKEILIDGKKAKYYKYISRGEIFIENPSIEIDYINQNGQFVIYDSDIQSLLNNIHIN